MSRDACACARCGNTTLLTYDHKLKRYFCISLLHCDERVEARAKWLTENKKRATTRTATALAAYDAHAATLDQIENEQQQVAWGEREAILSRAVSEAFADETADINDRETVLRCVRPCYWTRDDFLHRMYGAEAETSPAL